MPFSARLISLIFLWFVIDTVTAQVRPEFLYNTSMPYGELDIRTNISSTHYYYLDPNKTFSHRESTPGVRTNTYLHMTTWDSSPYQEGNLRLKKDATDKFIMNYRMLFPGKYDENYTHGYPLLLLFHGAVERGNCYYVDCYHGDFTYDPNINSPPAPSTPDHPLLNNDHQLKFGAPQHLQARDAANGKYPNDSSLPINAFPGFVLFPQMLNVWDSLNIQDVIRLVQLIAKNYQIDEDRIYVEGLSIGGYAVYEALKRAPWLFAAAAPMSAVTEAANIFRHQQQLKVRHVPIWAFQGGTDKNPSPAFTEEILKKFKNAGALPRYSLYPQYGHVVWTKAFSEPDFYQWFLTKRKTNIHVAFGVTQIDAAKNIFPVLEFAQGFLAYQWEKDGAILKDETSHKLTVKTAGKFRARFSRSSAAPTENQWSSWSQMVTITQVGGEDTGGEDTGGGDTGGEDTGGEDTGGEDTGGEDTGGDDDGGGEGQPPDSTDVVTTIAPNENDSEVELFPNPVDGEIFSIRFAKQPVGQVAVSIIDAVGKSFEVLKQGNSDMMIRVTLSRPLQRGLYIVTISTNDKVYRKRIAVR
jgi:hypothetical protein